MRTLLRFKILGVTVPVRFKKDLPDHYLGAFDAENMQIYLHPQIKSHLVIPTIEHEIVHAVMYITGLSQTLHRSQEETVCEGVMQLLRQNKMSDDFFRKHLPKKYHLSKRVSCGVSKD